MDLSKGYDLEAKASKGAWLELRDPITNEVLGEADGKIVRIKLRGADSMSYEEAIARSVALTQNTNKKKPGDKVSPIEIIEESKKQNQLRAEELAAITLEWENIEWNGQEFPYNHENALKLYNEHKWIREQGIEFFADRANYLGNE